MSAPSLGWRWLGSHMVDLNKIPPLVEADWKHINNQVGDGQRGVHICKGYECLNYCTGCDKRALSKRELPVWVTVQSHSFYVSQVDVRVSAAGGSVAVERSRDALHEEFRPMDSGHLLDIPRPRPRSRGILGIGGEPGNWPLLHLLVRESETSAPLVHSTTWTERGYLHVTTHSIGLYKVAQKAILVEDAKEAPRGQASPRTPPVNVLSFRPLQPRNPGRGPPSLSATGSLSSPSVNFVRTKFSIQVYAVGTDRFYVLLLDNAQVQVVDCVPLPVLTASGDAEGKRAEVSKEFLQRLRGWPIHIDSPSELQRCRAVWEYYGLPFLVLEALSLPSRFQLTTLKQGDQGRFPSRQRIPPSSPPGSAPGVEEDARALKKCVEDMMLCIVKALPDATADQAKEDLIKETKKFLKEMKKKEEEDKQKEKEEAHHSHTAEGKDEKKNEEEPEKPPAKVTDHSFVRVRDPRNSTAYRFGRILLCDNKFVYFHIFATEAEWKKAKQEKADPILEEKDEPLAIRHCTMKAKDDKSTAVLVEAPNPGYLQNKSDYSEKTLPIRKIKFDSHSEAEEWAKKLNGANGEDDGPPHVDTKALLGKITFGGTKTFANEHRHFSGDPKPALPSKEAMAVLVVSHFYELKLIPDIENEKLLGQPMPLFLKKWRYKSESALLSPRLAPLLERAFGLVETVLKKLAEYIQLFLDKLIAWIIHTFVRPVVEHFQSHPAQSAIKDKIIDKCKELSKEIPLDELRALLVQHNESSTARSTTIGFEEEHFKRMVSDELVQLIDQERKKRVQVKQIVSSISASPYLSSNGMPSVNRVSDPNSPAMVPSIPPRPTG